MIKLTDEMIETRRKLCDELVGKRNTINEAIYEANRRISRKEKELQLMVNTLVADITDEIEAYNSLVAKAAEFRQTVIAEIPDHGGYESWRYEWESLDLDGIGPPEVEKVTTPDIEAPDMDHAEALQEIPEENI